MPKEKLVINPTLWDFINDTQEESPAAYVVSERCPEHFDPIPRAFSSYAAAEYLVKQMHLNELEQEYFVLLSLDAALHITAKVISIGTATTCIAHPRDIFREALRENADKPPSKGAQALIDSGELTQWAKKPTIYFIRGFRKLALELDGTGNFKRAAKYTPYKPYNATQVDMGFYQKQFDKQNELLSLQDKINLEGKV